MDWWPAQREPSQQKVLWNRMCKGEALTLWGFAGLCLSSLPPVVPGTADRITSRAAVSTDVLLVEMRGTQPGISFKVQRINVLQCFVLPLTPNQCLPSSLSIEVFQELYPRQPCRNTCKASLHLCFGSMWFTLHSITIVNHGCLKVENYVKLMTCIACFNVLFSKAVVSAKSPKCNESLSPSG